MVSYHNKNDMILTLIVKFIIINKMYPVSNSKPRKKPKIIPPDHLVWNKDNENITFKVGNFLGSGGYAHCYEVTNIDTGDKYAAKITSFDEIEKSKHGRKIVDNEIDIHKYLNHPNIVKFIDFFETKEYIVILLELCSDGQSLRDIIKRNKYIPIDKVKTYLTQLLNALEYIHNKGIIHRDIKSNNVLLYDDNTIKICDFGLSKRVENTKKNKCGTPNYMPPEVLNGEDHTPMSDIWSLGVMLYYMIIGKAPFETSSIKETYFRIKRLVYYFPDNANISNTSKDLIRKIMRINPDSRLTIDQIRQHKFFTYVSTSPIINYRKNGKIVEIFRDRLYDYNRLGKSFEHPSNSPETPIFWLCRWIIHPDYGLFYQINNGNPGFSFNDTTHMINIYPYHIKYLYTSSRKDGNFKHAITIHPDDHESIPNADIKKKINLFKKFITILPNKKEPISSMIEDYTEQIRLARWKQTKHSIFFRLNNDTIQVHFNGGGSIIISNDGKVITYIDKHKEINSYWLDETPAYLNKKLRHIERTLTKFIEKNKT